MKKTISLLLALLMLLSLCACGEASGRSDAKAAAGSYMVAEEAAWPAEEPMAEASMAYDSVNGLSPAGAPQASGDTESAAARKPDKIIYSANVQVETTAFEESLAKLDALVEEYGGWVESSSLNGSNYADKSRGAVSRRSASYTLRIPSDRFQELMSSLSDLGNIPYSHIYTENVTAQYYDVQARLTAYKTQEQRLLEMMELAETVEDVILLEDRLTEVRYSIESLQTSLLNWDRKVSFSSVYLDLNEVQVYSPEPQVQPSYGQRLATALKSGLRDFGDFFKELLIWLAGALPTLLLLGAIAAVVIVVVRKRKAGRKARKAAAAAAPAPKEEQKSDTIP